MAGEIDKAQTERAQVFTISIIPFTQDGQINEPRFRRYLKKLGDAGMGTEEWLVRVVATTLPALVRNST